MNFKIGDKIKCIENHAMDISVNEIYTVYKFETRNGIGFVYLEETKSFIGYLARAFELVK
jgi:hypothetical protein